MAYLSIVWVVVIFAGLLLYFLIIVRFYFLYSGWFNLQIVFPCAACIFDKANYAYIFFFISNLL